MSIIEREKRRNKEVAVIFHNQVLVEYRMVTITILVIFLEIIHLIDDFL